MIHTTDPRYDPCRQHVEASRRNGRSWEEIEDPGLTPDQLDAWFLMQQKTSYWPSLGATAQERLHCWRLIIDGKREAEEAAVAATRPLVVVGREEVEPDLNVPTSDRSAWQLYRAYLESQDWKETAVRGIEDSSIRILRHLRRRTSGQPAKGLVVGYVQSGKTASMAGLISMGADHGWNLFIVLSGTLENLRIQTRRRLFHDLNHPGTLSWKYIEHASPSIDHAHRTQSLLLSQVSRDRHLIVSLKNSSRLEALIAWIRAHPGAMENMRVVVIDDEADQAGINTADVSADERSRINGLIRTLVSLPVQSINYVAYTATPAANFLNESPGPGTLFPDDFIVCLPQPDEHFGPAQVFGTPGPESEPLGIIRDVSQDELSKLLALHNGQITSVPESLEEALLWFLCCVSALRFSNFRKPISMLIHTSARQAHHASMDQAIRGLLLGYAASPELFLARCAEVWQARTADLDVGGFAERLPKYGRLNEVQNYPQFEQIRPFLNQLLTFTSIPLDQEGRPKYHRGLHICVDNCANNGITDENELRRLFYPDPDNGEQHDFATAFVVIGGGTLSRGLTIENLVSTFFLRASAQADSLMQMGRWFGYRRGYELLPRIWMPAETRRKFEFMSLAEEDLRDDLERFMDQGVRPSEAGPRIMVHPSSTWLRPTAANRMQQSFQVDVDYSGINRQTTIFHDGAGAGGIHRSNRTKTDAFLEGLKGGRRGQGNSLVWEKVSVDAIAAFLEGLTFHPSTQFFSDLTPFLQWLSSNANEAGYGEWNVVAAGADPASSRPWELPGGRVGMVKRTRVDNASRDGAVSIGALRDPRDLFADTDAEVPKGGVSVKEVDAKRSASSSGPVPQLLLYLIDRDSRPSVQRAGSHRAALAAEEDILGISLWLPPVPCGLRSFANRLTVRIPEVLLDAGDDLGDSQ